MATCCDTSPGRPTEGRVLTIALAGNPNSGKTTLFNALTGLRQKVANYPGVTVERKTGRCKLPDGSIADVIDLPGTYSLISRSPDERVAMEVLRGLRKDMREPDVVIVVVDASNLSRNLYLVSQLVEMGRPLVVALNMMDVAERRGLAISPQRLEAQLGVPVVGVVGNRRRGIDELKVAVLRARVAPMPDWQLPAAMKEELIHVGSGLAEFDIVCGGTGLLAHGSAPASPAGKADRAGGDPGPVAPRAWICRGDSDRRIDRYQAVAERLLIGDTASDLSAVAAAPHVSTLLAGANQRLHAAGVDPMQADIEAHYRWIDTVTAASLVPACAALNLLTLPDEKLAMQPCSAPAAASTAGAITSAASSHAVAPLTRSEQLDHILVHKFWGLLIFAAIMSLLFVSIFWLAQPIMDAIQSGFTWAGDIGTRHLADGPLKDLISGGIFAGVGSVVVFLPQIALLFFFLAILEDSGYLARAAFLMDRLLSRVGLHGKSFIPLLSSFACAIPGIMATRTIENRKDRLVTILIAPFMSCSARLPVYTLLIGTFFVGTGALGKAGIMLGCYALGILAAVVTALVFKRTLLKGAASSFILEMPTYKMPQASIVLRQVWSNSKAFLTKAGTIIFSMSVVLWALAYYPRLPQSRAVAVRSAAVAQAAANPAVIAVADANRPAAIKELADSAVAAAQSEFSVAGRFGHGLEPVIRPLGYDWKMGVGLVAAFAAREVFVSAEGIVYAAGNTDKSGTQALSTAMLAERHPDGTPVWSKLVAVSLLVWFVLALQCMSTVAVVRRETGGWGWPIFMIVYMNVLAYVVCLAVFQIGSLV